MQLHVPVFVVVDQRRLVWQIQRLSGFCRSVHTGCRRSSTFKVQDKRKQTVENLQASNSNYFAGNMAHRQLLGHATCDDVQHWSHFNLDWSKNGRLYAL